MAGQVVEPKGLRGVQDVGQEERVSLYLGPQGELSQPGRAAGRIEEDQGVGLEQADGDFAFLGVGAEIEVAEALLLAYQAKGEEGVTDRAGTGGFEDCRYREIGRVVTAE